MNDNNIALQVKGVYKTFKLPTEQASGIKQAVINRLKGIKGYKEQKVLKNINLTVNKGDFFGIVGRNGSGKSTLLKIISQIYQPNKGKVIVNGSLVPFIELGVGFNPELTGRENIYVNGALLGFSPKQIDKMYDEIVEFAELDGFMDQKLKNYSSGMQVRLAFSVAIKAEADILILDEVLAVGDAAFQRKCYEHFGKLKKDKKTVILVTHEMETVRQYCNKAILINDGEIASQSDNVDDVANEYLKLFNKNTQQESTDKSSEEDRWGVGDISVDNITANYKGTSIIVDVVLKSRINVEEGFIFALRFLTVDGSVIAGSSTRNISKKSLSMKAGETLKLRFDIPNKFGHPTITIGYHLVNFNNTTVFDSQDSVLKLDNTARPSYYPVVFDNATEIIERKNNG